MRAGQLVKYSNGIDLGLRGQLGIVTDSGGLPDVWASKAGHQVAWYKVHWLNGSSPLTSLGRRRRNRRWSWTDIELLTEATDESR